MKNMTVGSPVRLILAFALPMFIGNVFQQAYSMVDTMIAGRFLGEQAIAAIGAIATLYSLLMNIAWGLNNGYCVVLSRAFGAGDMGRFRRSVAAMIGLNVAVALVLTALSLAFLRPLMGLLHTPADIFGQAYRYILIILAGMVTTVAYNACAGYLRAMGNSRTPLAFLILSSLLNISLDLLFIAALHRGVGGAALATVLAQGVSAALCGGYIWKHCRECLPNGADWRPERATVGEMFATGFSMAMMQAVFALGSVILQRAINALGSAVITAHTASRRVYEMLMVPMSTLASADSTFVGQNYGAGKYDRIVQANRKALLMELGWSLVSVAACWLLGRRLMVWLTGTSNEEIIQNALLNLRLSTACFFPLGALFVLRYSMQAMDHKVLPVLSSTIELAGKILSAAALVPALGYLGVAVTEPVIWCVCAAFLAVSYATVGHQRRYKRISQTRKKPPLCKGMRAAL